jgi:outer membrane protein assembly factor BamB
MFTVDLRRASHPALQNHQDAELIEAMTDEQNQSRGDMPRIDPLSSFGGEGRGEEANNFDILLRPVPSGQFRLVAELKLESDRTASSPCPSPPKEERGYFSSFISLVLLSFCLASGLHAAETNWPQFRGPRGDGTSTAESLPLHWSEKEHIKWKTAIHDKGWSSPVIWDNQIWMTTATKDGKELFVVCVDALSGNILRDQKLFDIEKPQFAHEFNSYASPTSVIEEHRLYATFGSPGTACLDTRTGTVLWKRTDVECNHFRGAGSSPILFGNLFILNYDGSDHQFILALDKATGRTVWQKDRSMDFKDVDADGHINADGDFRKAFATCQVATLDGRPTLLSQGSKALYAYDPSSGDELWRVEERNNYSGPTRPVVGHGMVFFPSGFSSGQLLAIKPGAKGEVLDANSAEKSTNQLQVVWRTKKSIPKKPSLTLVGDYLFAIDDNGVATCWEAKSGRTLWNERVGGNYSASPLAGAGRIYFFSEEGKITVVDAGPEYKVLAENHLDDGFMSSPAVTGHALILRTRTHLYRIEE